jgi:hypothetical protein
MLARTLSSRSANRRKSIQVASAPASAASFAWMSSFVEREHPAVRMRDHEGFPGTEEPVRDEERPEYVVRDDATGVSDHVSIAVLEPQELGRVEACVHAGDDHEPPGR